MIHVKVVQLESPNLVKFIEKDLDEENLEFGAILCETLVTAISPGTELAAYNGLPPLRPATGYPRLQGYCNVSQVIAKGSQVKSVNIGDRILTFQSHRSHFIVPES